jgi:L-fuconolactonase
VPWPKKTDALLYRTVLPRDYRALEMPRPADATVVVEASPWVEDNQWILDLAKDDPFLIGLVGNLPVGTDEFPALLDRFAANPLFFGMRVHEWEWKAKRMDDRGREHLKRLARLHLELDLNPAPSRLPEVARLLGELPGLRVVIDHVSNVKIDGGKPPETWRKGIAAVAAASPTVYCKVSGLVEGSGRAGGKAPRTLDHYRRTLDVVWEAFGEDRLIYGSNWPVCARFAPASVTQQLILDYASARGAATLEKLFWKNATAAYRCRFRGNG